MSPAATFEAENIDPGYRLVSLQREEKAAPLRICLVVKADAEPVGGPFVLLRELADASVYLGAIADYAGRPHEWLEIWVQNVDRFAAGFPTYRDLASNAALDTWWKQRAATFRALESASFLATGWEDAPVSPIFFDGRNAAPATFDKASWQLCQDDALLTQKGLPAYSTSLARYLHNGHAGEEASFVPITSGAPENAATHPLAETFPSLVAFNPGGRMLVRTFSPLPFDQWVSILSGLPWRGLEHGPTALRLSGVYRTLENAISVQCGTGHLFLGKRGLAGRLAEAFHLKLQTIATTFRLVRDQVQKSQLPLLNISDASFRVSLNESDTTLPYLWNSRITLAVPGEAVALQVATTKERYFLPAKFGRTSIYRPAALNATVDAVGQVRIRKVLSGPETVLEGTLVTQEKLPLGGSDLLWLRLPLPSGRVDLYARTEAANGGGAGEIRFRTLPQDLAPAALAALRQAEGVPFPSVPFQTVPLLSSPCDLYALGVLAARTLLADEETSLPVAFDELLSLASRSAATYDPEQPAGERLHALALGLEEFRVALGPHRLLHEKIAPEAALFPPDLWWDSISLITRCFPGSGPDSFCRDFGDAPPLALENVFTEPLAILDQLLTRSRSLIVSDWAGNREIHSIIGKLRERIAAH